MNGLDYMLIFELLLIGAAVYFIIIKPLVYIVRLIRYGNAKRKYKIAVQDARNAAAYAKHEKAQAAAQRKQAAADDRQRKAALKKQQAEMEIERLQAEFDEQRELNDIIQDRYETIVEEKRKSDAMAVENPALMAKYEKVLRQRITSQNKMRSLQKKIENLTDIINL